MFPLSLSCLVETVEKPTKLLIDGDGILYRCGFAVEKTHYLATSPSGEAVRYDMHKDIPKEQKEEWEIWTRQTLEPIENAYYLIGTVLNKLYDRFKLEQEIYLSPSVGNFRDRLATIKKYKGNRDGARKPTYYDELRAFLMEKYGATVASGQEADDELGIRATSDAGAIIVSLDKDLDQIPGRHYNWVKDDEYTIGKKEGTVNFYSQVLSGDSTDNIPGIYGLGPVKARKMLAPCNSSRDCWETVLSTYREHWGKHPEDAALEVARLCWVRRKPEEIWSPPK